jgi:dienelactone hydrolase
MFAAAAALLVALASPAAASAFDPALEAKNFAKVTERNVYVTGDPGFQARLLQQNALAPVQFAQLKAADPERDPLNICAIRSQECAGDVRFYDWASKGYGVQTPVVFTARSGAVISGSVWSTVAGPPKRPGVVITTGSVQAPETLYWGIAANLAKAGYVVLTYDVQGQGQSDTLGEAPDAQEGVPSQAGQPFFDGTEDALDFLLSTPGSPYDPRPSCGNANGGVGTDHSPKHDRRVADGLDAAYNPAHGLVDPSRVGIAGHSLGASAVSFIGQKDPRVDAIVAYDNLSAPDEGVFGGQECPSNPDSRLVPPITKPAMGISNDYGLTPTPYTSDPDPQGKNAGSRAYSDAGVDNMQVNIRGGTHYESSLIPGNTTVVLGTGTRRGQDLVTWYTLAWLDKYVMGDSGADARLLTDRWCDDDLTREVDRNDDGNMYSFYFRSRQDFALAGGGRATSEDMRSECPEDATDPPFDMVAAASTPDGPATAAGPSPAPVASSKKQDCHRLQRRLKRAEGPKQRKKLKRKLRRCRARG